MSRTTASPAAGGLAARTALILSFVAFISLGMPDGLHGVAWPDVRAAFALPLDAIGLATAISIVGYMTSSFFVGALVRKLGIGALLSASCALTGLSLLGFGLTPVWWLFVAFALLTGLGAGAIDAGLNAWVARTQSEGTMQWLHAFFGVGITLGPLIMTGAVVGLGLWRVGYLVVGVTQLLLAALFWSHRQAWQLGESGEAEAIGESDSPDSPALVESFRLPGTWLSILLFFLYTGVELGLGLWAFTVLTESRGIAPATAGLVTGAYWASFTVGRVAAGLAAGRLRMSRILPVAIAAAAVALLLFTLNLGDAVSIASLAVVGFSLGPIFPGFVSDTARRVGTHQESNVIGIEIAGAGFGTAVLPAMAGVLARRAGLETIPRVLLLLFVGVAVVYAIAHLRGAAQPAE